MRTGSLLALLLFVTSTATADPLVKPGAKPGAVSSWSTVGEDVVLIVGNNYEADDVAKAITAKIKGSKTKVNGNSVVVSGVEEKALVPMLARVEVEPALDDVDQMLSALKGGGDEEEGSGSSIRATQVADFSDVLGAQKDRIEGEVVGVTRSSFPVVIVSVKVTKVPRGTRGIAVGNRITVVPRVKSKNGVVDPNDRPSQLNVGAWYAQEGDQVVLNLGKKRQKKYWIARGFERRPAP